MKNAALCLAFALLATACGGNDASNGDLGGEDAGTPDTGTIERDFGAPDAGPTGVACGDEFCEGGEVCVSGACFAGCQESSECGAGELCFAGRCATSACDGVVCADGETCAAGACRTECAADADCAPDGNCFRGACYPADQVPNVGPEVNAGPDQTVAETAAVTVVGSAIDPDGSIAATAWTQLSGDAIAFTDSGTTLEFTAPGVTTVQTYEFELRAFDDFGDEASDTVTITVEPIIAPPVADAGADFESNHDIVVALSGSATDEGTIVSWQWTQTDGPNATFLVADQPDATFEAPVVTTTTTLTFELTVTDDDGATGTDEVVVTLVPVNTPPVVDAGVDQVVRQSDVVTLLGTATDPNVVNNSITVTWTQTSGTDVTLTGGDTLNPSFDAPASVDCIETLVFDLSVRDASGSTINDTVNITVLADGNAVTPDTMFDLEDATGGNFVATGQWEHGSPSSGINRAYSGGNVWATVLDGDASANTTSYLAMPPLDLTAATDPVLSFRMWVRAGALADGLSVEISRGAGWNTVPNDVFPAYVDATHWDNTVGPVYEAVDIDLGNYEGDHVCARFKFYGDGFIGVGPGAYIDDIGLHTEASDPDGDGLPGVRTERLTSGTDPFLADTDNDGVDDGVELMTDMTNPANPADFAGAAIWTPGMTENFDGDDGGLAAWPGFQWEHGAPSNGPGVAHSIGNLWGTDLDGSYVSNAVDYVYLPVVDLTNATDPTFSMFIWTNAGLFESHGANLQVRVGTDSWTTVPAQIEPYSATTMGESVWNNLRGVPGRPDSPFVLTAASLQPWAGDTIELRIGFYSNGGRAASGTYFDDISIYEESADPDNDGLPGVLTEFDTHGTQPFIADTDTDGIDDGTELLTDATPALNPAIYNGSPTWTPELYEDFDNATGSGLATDGSLWEHGFPANGPGAAYSGTFVWGTNLGANTFVGATEHLYLPEIDLTAATNPTLSLRFWTRPGFLNQDGTNVQVLTSTGWQTLAMSVTPYNRTPNDHGQSIWSDFTEWTFAAGSLAAFVGDRVQVRISYLDVDGRTSPGTFIDDIAITEETSDPDGDGVVGVIAEALLLGTDPFLADTDGDTINDGLDTDPLDPLVQ